MRAFGSLVADALAVFLFVAIGLLQHGSPLTTVTVTWVGWTFAVGMLVGHLAIRSWRAPFAVWPQGVFVWAITIVAAMALRTLFGQGTETSFIVVTAIVLGVLMLGWRAVASFVTRHERRAVVSLADLEGSGDAGAVGPGTADSDDEELDGAPASGRDGGSRTADDEGPVPAGDDLDPTGPDGTVPDGSGTTGR
ncbi:DUF3054 domain-containing protein [Brachybacterium sp. AOP25-B2-12]|uniref:DUF3054 domain-containing protein n=1 Tax=Brachybacterium sp. AOP25-B2-12 TaxID=3457710 RepID=UPI004033A23C